MYVGWTTAQFCYVASQFHTGSGVWGGEGGGGDCGETSEGVYGQRLKCTRKSESEDSACDVEQSYSSAYLVSVQQLLSDFTGENLAVPVR